MPESVRSEDIKAQLKDGVLTLSMPLTEEARKSERSIEVEQGLGRGAAAPPAAAA